MEKDILVVGDRFKNFSINKNVVIESDYLKYKKIPKDLTSNIKFIPGQGVSIETINNNTDRPILKNKFTHKRNQENILIGNTVKKEDNLYIASLIIDENSELMLDHQTGQHIQGMVAIEALRQMFIATTEEHFFPEQNDLKYYVIDNMNISFIKFLFPIAASIEYKIVKHQPSKLRDKFIAEISLIQNESVCMTMEVKFTVYSHSYILEKENSLALDSMVHILCNNSGVLL